MYEYTYAFYILFYFCACLQLIFNKVGNIGLFSLLKTIGYNVFCNKISLHI